jgi:hypothetical protein
MARIIRALRGNSIALLALFVALGGTSYAAMQLPRNSVGSKQIRESAVNSKKVRDGSLRARDFARGQLPGGQASAPGAVGPQGPRGEQGPAGSQGERGETGLRGPSAGFAGDVVGGMTDRPGGADLSVVATIEDLPAGDYVVNAHAALISTVAASSVCYVWSEDDSQISTASRQQLQANAYGAHAIAAALTLEQAQDLHLKCAVFNPQGFWNPEGRGLTAVRVGSLTEG